MGDAAWASGRVDVEEWANRLLKLFFYGFVNGPRSATLDEYRRSQSQLRELPVQTLRGELIC
jgi:hypothetical protein